MRNITQMVQTVPQIHRRRTFTFNRSVFRKFNFPSCGVRGRTAAEPMFIEHAFFYLIIVKFKHRNVLPCIANLFERN